MIAGTNIVLYVSNGQAPSSNSGGSSNNNTPSWGGGNSGGSTPTTPSQPETPSCDASKGANLIIQTGSSGNDTKNMIIQLNPYHKFSWNMVTACPDGESTPGAICTPLNGVWKNYCDTITITLVK